MNLLLSVCFLFCCFAFSTRQCNADFVFRLAAAKRSNVPQTVDDAVMTRALTFQPRTDAELEQFRILTHLLKLLIDKRAKQLERISSANEGRAARVKNELTRLRSYKSSLEKVMRKFGLTSVADRQLQQRGRAESNDESSVSKNVVNGINQPIWLLEQLRKVEQHRRRSRSLIA